MGWKLFLACVSFGVICGKIFSFLECSLEFISEMMSVWNCLLVWDSQGSLVDETWAGPQDGVGAHRQPASLRGLVSRLADTAVAALGHAALRGLVSVAVS